MKGFWKFLLGSILGGALGWALGYLRFPSMEPNQAFWIGSIACLALILLILAILNIWNKNTLFFRLIGKSPKSSETTPKKHTAAKLFTIASLLIVLASLGTTYLLYQQNLTLKTQTDQLQTNLQAQADLVASIHKSNQDAQLANVLAKLDAELATNPDSGALSPDLITRVANLCASLKPYRYYAGDTLTARAFSPEKGQLLLTLCNMPIDSASFLKLKKDAPFYGADLHGAHLQGFDLSHADLKGANLRDADLRGANLSNTDLSFATLWGAKLDSANLQGSNLRRANLGWAELNATDLRNATLNGADLQNAKFRNANLTGAVMKFTTSVGALFHNAILVQVDLVGSNLQKANFTQANLTEANLIVTDLTDANLKGTQLYHLSCGKDFLDKLTQWRIAEAATIQKSFKVVDDSARRYITAVHRLEPIAP